MFTCEDIDEGCKDPIYEEPIVIPPLPEDDCNCSGGGSGEGHKYTFRATATGWQVLEDGKPIYSYTDKDTNTTYTWQATAEGWLVKDNTGKTIFTYTDKSGENTTYNFEKKDDCGFKVTDSDGKVVFDYDNDCAGTTYTYEQDGANFKVTDNKTGKVVFNYKGTEDTNTTYTYENYKDGFKVLDDKGTVVYLYDPNLGKDSDGSYAIDTLLTTVFKGHTTISLGQIVSFDPANLVVGETLVYDGVGTVGVITKDNGDGTYQVTTMTTSPGTRQGVRLGSVSKEEDLPKTCAEAEAKGWQTPQLGDFAYVIEGDGTSDDVISEYLVTSDTDCNLTWTFSHSFNAGQYQEQSSLSMSGMILTGGALPGTFGTPIDPKTLIRGVMRNGVLLTPDAQGKVNVIVDDSHIIVNALPTTNIVDKAEYVVIDADLKVTGTWVHDDRGWFQTYAAVTQVKAHQVVTALPTTNIEENVEYVVVDDQNKVTGTWVYDPTKGWLQTEVLDKPAHIVVKDLPTTDIDDEAEYVQVEDLTDPVNTYLATWVHTNSGWIKTGETTKATAAHIAVKELPTTNINENAEYLVMTDTSDPTTLTGTWVRVNGNWVQTEKMESGFHIVTSLPTSDIDDKNDYIVVEDLDKPDETLIGHYAYDSNAKKWISLNSKYEVYRGLTVNGYTTNADDFQDSPVGNIIGFMGNNSPAHYLAADGAEYNIGTYPELEAFFVEQFGKVNEFGGNGTTTWAVPDLRGEFLRGTGENSHTSALPSGVKEGDGADVGEHQGATTMTTVNGSSNTQLFVENSVGDYRPQNPDQVNKATGGKQLAWSTTLAHNGTLNMASLQPMTTRPTNTSVLWCIKAESTYAIVPNTDYKVTAALNFATNLTGNSSYRSGSITSSEDDTSMVNGNAVVIPVDGYYNVTLTVPAVAVPTASSYYGGFVFKNFTPTDTVFKNWQTNSVAWDIQTTPGTAWSGCFITATATVKLAKGDKLTCAVGGGNVSPTGKLVVALDQPISQTQVSRAELMLKPNTWPIGVEQDFGDGVYGVRIKADNIGTAGSYIPSFTMMGITSIVNYGGCMKVDNDGTLTAFPAYHSTVAWEGLWYGKGDGKFRITRGSQYTKATDDVDIWILYTK